MNRCPAPAAALLAAAVLAATPAGAATYYWKQGSTFADYGTVANWSTESMSGADAASLPGPGDVLELNADYALDLGGDDWSLASWGPEKTNAGAERSLSIRNGSLAFANLDAAPSSITVSNATLAVTGRLGGGNNGSGTDLHQYLTIQNGGVVSVHDLNPCRFLWTVEEGGTLSFNNKYLGAYGNAANVTDPSKNGIWNRGTLNLTPTSNGSASEFSLSGNKGANWHFTLAQQGGTMNLPCSINGTTTTSGRTVYLYVSFSGGTINVTGDATVQNCKTATLSGDTTWNVASGKTANLSAVSVEAGASVAKAGTGTLVLKSVPDVFAVTNGTASLSATIPSSSALQTADVRDGGTLSVDVSGASIETLEDLQGTLALAKPNLTVSAVDENATLSGSVTVDLASFATGGTLITTPSAALRAKVLAAAEEAISASGAALTVADDGSSVVITTAGAVKVFDSTTVTDLADAAGWRDGDVPAAGETALVSGEGVVGTLTAAALAKGWSGIAVQNGATLRLEVLPDGLALDFDDGTTLAAAEGVSVNGTLASAAPALLLEPGAGLVAEAGDDLALDGWLRTSADAETGAVPTLTARDGASVSVSSGHAFKNVKLVLESGSTLSADGGVSFGHAAAGETAWFAMTATNATIDAGGGRVRFGSPESGGTVIIDGPVDLVGVSFSGTAGFTFGSNNPADAPFEVAAVGTSIPLSGSLAVGGAATLSLSGGASVNGRNTSAVSVSDAGTIRIASGGLVKYMYSQGSTYLDVRGAAGAERPGIVLAGGTLMPCQLSGSSARTAAVSADSDFDCYYHDMWGRQPRPFDSSAFSSVAIDGGATLSVRNVNGGEWNSADNLARAYTPGTAPVTGAGNVVFTNAYPGSTAKFTLQGGANTCTGTIAALGDRCTLVLADGCNWAGTLVANGNVSLAADTNATRVSLGGVRFEEDLPIRLWEDGRSDAIDFGTAGFSGTGALAFVAGEEGFDPTASARAKWMIGTIPAGAAPPPLASRRWTLSAVETEDPAVSALRLSSRAFTLLVVR